MMRIALSAVIWIGIAMSLHAEPITIHVVGVVADDELLPPARDPGGGFIRNACHELWTEWPTGALVDLRMTAEVEPNGDRLWRMQGPGSLRLDGEILPHYGDGTLIANILGNSDPTLAELVQIGAGQILITAHIYRDDLEWTSLVLEVTQDMHPEVYSGCVLKFDSLSLTAVPVPEPSGAAMWLPLLLALAVRAVRTPCPSRRR